MTGRLLTADQLAQRWQVPKSQVYRLTREGGIPAVKLGRYYRYPPDLIEAFERGEWVPGGDVGGAGVGSAPTDKAPPHRRNGRGQTQEVQAP